MLKQIAQAMRLENAGRLCRYLRFHVPHCLSFCFASNHRTDNSSTRSVSNYIRLHLNFSLSGTGAPYLKRQPTKKEQTPHNHNAFHRF